MKKTVTVTRGLAVVAAVAFIGGCATMEGDKGDAMMASAGQWTGTLVDTRCMAMDASNAGNDHKKGALKGCGSACAKMGIPVALLVDGKMHPLAAPAPMLADHMAKEAQVTGKMTGSLILPEKVVVEGREVNVGGMM